MRKLVIEESRQQQQPKVAGDWLDLDQIARVEITSEEPEHPIESALTPGADSGWRASESGRQTIRLLFDEPQKISHIQLLFDESSRERTQEFVLRWSPDMDNSREIVRQQYNFSPGGNNQELEDYSVNLEGVMALEIIITPDISGGDAQASLEQLRLA